MACPGQVNALPAELVLVQRIQLFVHQLPQLRGCCCHCAGPPVHGRANRWPSRFSLASAPKALFCPSGLPSSASFSGSLRLACGSWRKGMQAAPALCPISQMRFIKHTTARHRLLEQLRHAGSGQRPCFQTRLSARTWPALALSPPNNDDKPGGKRAALALCALPAASKTRGRLGLSLSGALYEFGI